MLAVVNLLETLRSDIEKIADSDLPSQSEVVAVVGALIKRVEAAAKKALEQGKEDAIGLLAGDPDPVVDPATTITPLAPDGSPLPVTQAGDPVVLPSDAPAQQDGTPAVISVDPHGGPGSTGQSVEELEAQIRMLQAKVAAQPPTAPVVTSDAPLTAEQQAALAAAGTPVHVIDPANPDAPA
jgi:hypothetical protein